MSAIREIARWDTDLSAEDVRRLSPRNHKSRIAASMLRKVAIVEGLATGAEWSEPGDPPLTRTALRAWKDPDQRLWSWASAAADAVGGPHDALVRRFLDAAEAVRERKAGRRVSSREQCTRERRNSDRLRAQVIDLERRLRECLAKR